MPRKLEFGVSGKVRVFTYTHTRDPGVNVWTRHHVDKENTMVEDGTFLGQDWDKDKTYGQDEDKDKT